MPAIPLGINLPDQAPVRPLDQRLQNVIATAVGLQMRPGCTLAVDTTVDAAIIGLFDWTPETSKVVAVTATGKTYLLSLAGMTDDYLLLEDASYLLLEDGGRLILDYPPTAAAVTGPTDLNTNQRVRFAPFSYGTAQILYMANGTKVFELFSAQSFVTHAGKNWSCKVNHTAITTTNEPGGGSSSTYWNDLGAGSDYTAWAAGTRYGSGTATALEDTSWPSSVSFIAIVDNYLLALDDGTQLVYYSTVDAPWDNAGTFFSAEQSPDPAKSMISVGDSIWVAGDRSLERWVDDGVTPWINDGYGALDVGILAPQSLTFCTYPGILCFIDTDKRVVQVQGRQATPLNPTLDTFIRRLGTATDAIGSYLVIEGIPYYILEFPTTETTITVNLTSGIWAEWYSTMSSQQKRWVCGPVTNCATWDMLLGGSNQADGYILRVSTDLSTDNGTALPDGIIRAPRMTTGRETRVPELSVALARVSSSGSSDVSFDIKWRSDGEDWLTERTVTLSDQTKTDYVKHLYRLGSYRRYRQYEVNGNWHPYAITALETA